METFYANSYNYIKRSALNLSTKQEQTHRHRELVCGCQGVVGRERDGLRVWGW